MDLKTAFNLLDSKIKEFESKFQTYLSDDKKNEIRSNMVEFGNLLNYATFIDIYFDLTLYANKQSNQEPVERPKHGDEESIEKPKRGRPKKSINADCVEQQYVDYTEPPNSIYIDASLGVSNPVQADSILFETPDEDLKSLFVENVFEVVNNNFNFEEKSIDSHAWFVFPKDTIFPPIPFCVTYKQYRSYVS